MKTLDANNYDICVQFNFMLSCVKHEKSFYMSRVVRKPAFCICENKNTDQLCGNREADQHFCFCYMESTIPLFP